MTDFELRPPDLANLVGGETGRDHVSHSSLGTFLACQQCYGWGYEHQLEPAVASTPLELGRAFAHALEHGNPDTGEQQLRAQAHEQTKAAVGNPWLVAPQPAEVDVHATIVREASRAYLARFGTAARREVEMRVRVRNPARGGRYSLTHDLVGRVDGLSEDGLELVEDKLMGQLPSPTVLMQRLRLDRQVTIGCYLHWRVTGQQIQRVRYRITRKPSIKRRKDEGHDEYLQRVADDYAARPDFYLLEEVVTREPDDYLRLEQELWTWVEQIREARRTGVWPRNTGACFDYGGCAFLPLCAREPGAIHQFKRRERRDQQVSAPAATHVKRASDLKEAA